MPPERIATVEAVKPVLLRALRASRATAVHHAWHLFEPQGMSATVLIAESHFCLHSWPEYGYMGVDILTCGEEMDAEVAIRVLAEGLGARETVTTSFARGIPS